MSITWIEASAGTGKTYTLVQTVLRLVVDQGLPVERILLVTFTDKATAELKTRIRRGLREAWKSTHEPRLAQAIEDLSSLSITTIHGFCRTLLTQFPLESGVSFEPQMVDQGRQWRRLLREELRPRLTNLDANLLFWAGVEEEEALLGLAKEALDRNLFSLPLLHPNREEQERFHHYRDQLETGTGPLWEALRAEGPLNLPEDPVQGLGAETIERFLHGGRYKNPYHALKSLVEAQDVRDLAKLLKPETLEYATRWAQDYDPKRGLWKKGSDQGRPPHLEALCAVSRGIEAALTSWTSVLPPGVDLGSFLAGAARHAVLEDLCLPVLNRRSTKELTFHDLIDRVGTLVNGPRGAGLAAGASARWTAVLIDEFQDTDPEQWQIFRSLFGGPGHQLVLVGDPKQSIYRFRGADLDVYRAVRNQVKAEGAQTLVLDQNFRSTAPMIEAVNQLFDPQRAPWDHPEDFHPSQKGDKPIATLVRQTDAGLDPIPPLAVYQHTDERRWHRHLVQTVVELLDGTTFLDDETTRVAVTPGDFLILVRKKKEAWTLYRMLSARGVPATVGGSGGLLRGREAQEVLLFLKALENPRSLSAARALVWTRLFAGANLDGLLPALDEAQADRDGGAFLRAFRRVAAALEPQVPDGGGLEKILEQPGGPRIVTNAEHVLELVQERFHRGEVPPGQAALSLETWIQSGLQEDEVDLRRDRESPTLRLMTVHAAKGLEAPIVLHGYPSGPPKGRDRWIIAGGVDFLKTEANQKAEERASQAEDLRLRYVALTRAQAHQVFLDPTWPGALPVPPGGEGTFEGGSERGAAPEVPGLAGPLSGLETRHPWVESHSGLWRRANRDDSGPRTVWDRPLVHREEEGDRGGLHDPSEVLPAGPAFGDLVHDILEVVDYRAWAPGAQGLRAQADAVLEEHCLRNRANFQGRDLSRPLSQWLGEALNHEYPLGDGSVRLSALAPDDTRRELEFHLPLAHPVPRSFAWGSRTLVVHPGFLTGRIDLLFRWEGRLYLADWKTNRMAPGQDPAEVMIEAGYDLQAQWYWEALQRLVQVQGEALKPGGVLYVFLRGTGTGPTGVFLPPEALNGIDTLHPFLKEATHG